MQPVSKVAKRDIPHFAILLPVIDVHEGRPKVELSHRLE